MRTRRRPQPLTAMVAAVALGAIGWLLVFAAIGAAIAAGRAVM